VTESQIPAMKLNYFPDTDSLYIDLAHPPSSKAAKFRRVLFLITTAMATWSGSISITPAANWICANSLLSTFHSKPQQKRKHKFLLSEAASFINPIV
jgi:hypothetical protein